MFRQYQQLNDGPIPGNPGFVPINNEELGGEDREKSLEAMNLIKEKLCGNIKGITYANGS